jgi:isoleucyl-tRNA synthetase
LQSFPKIPLKWKNEKLSEKWKKFKTIRKVVNAAMEVKRASKDIGSSLEAEVQIYLNDEYIKIAKDFNLAENFITSKAEIKTLVNGKDFFELDEVKGIKVFVKKAEGKKCPRCWKFFPELCKRCNLIN